MNGKKKMTADKFSEYVMDLHDLYNLAYKNDFYLPCESSSAINEIFLMNVLSESRESYWCPKFD